MILASLSASAANTPHNRSGASSPGPSSNAAGAPPQLFTAKDRRRAAQKQRSGSQSQADAEVSASSDLTTALRRTHDLISAELSRSEFAQQVLHESTVAMKELQQRYSTLDDMLASSRDLLGTLLKSQKSDTWYLETALYMLLGTLAWLVFRRFLYGPLWWIVWLPVRTVFRTGKAVTNIGMGSGSATMEIPNPEGTGRKVVGVGEEGAVPTVSVGSERTEEGEPGSLVDKIGRIIDDNLNPDDGHGQTQEDDAEGVEPHGERSSWEEQQAEGEYIRGRTMKQDMTHFKTFKLQFSVL